MPDPAESAPTGQTVELARGDLREQLPGVEPERRVTDWGRSERVEGLVDRTLYDFLYHYWFRVEVEGVENVPSDGGALLLANHAGGLPADAAMVAKAVWEEHRRPRALHLMTGQRILAVPAVGMLVTKLGAVQGHPANLHRLMFDEHALVLGFPEAAGTKSLKDRYRVRPFAARPLLAAALRAQAPIVPVAVLGAEEALPVFARFSLMRRLTRLPALALTPGLLLPAKFKIRFLEPVHTDALGDAPWHDGALVQALAHDVRALIQENLLEMVAQRRSVWLG